MVEPTDLGQFDDLTELRRMYITRLGSVLVQRQMCPRPVIQVQDKVPTRPSFTESTTGGTRYTVVMF